MLIIRRIHESRWAVLLDVLNDLVDFGTEWNFILFSDGVHTGVAGSRFEIEELKLGEVRG